MSAQESAFLRKLADIIDKNLDDEHLDADKIAELMNLSRFQVYRKLKAASGKSITEYLREYRLKKAVDLLLDGKYQVAEVAYRVGFGSPSYFTKCFTEYYGLNPSEVNDIEGIGSLLENDEKKSHKRSNRKAYRISAIAFLGLILSISVISYLFSTTGGLPLASEHSVLILPVKTDGTPSLDSLGAGLSAEVMEHLRIMAGISSIFYDFDRNKIETDRQLFQLGAKLDVDYIVDLDLRSDGEEIALRMQISALDKRSETFHASAQGSKDDLPGIAKTFLDEFVFEEELAISYGDPRLQTTADTINVKLQESLHAATLYTMILEYGSSAKDLSFALKMAKEALSIDSLNLEANFLLGELYVRLIWSVGLRPIGTTDSQYLDSLAYIAEKLISVYPRQAEGYLLKAQIHVRKGELDSIVSLSETVLELDSTNFRAYELLSGVYSKEPVKNLKYLELARKYDKLGEKMPWILGNIGEVYRRLGKFDISDSILNYLVTVAPKNRAVASNYLYNYLVKGKYDQLREAANNLCNTMERCPLNMYYIWTYVAEGRYDMAARSFSDPFYTTISTNTREHSNNCCEDVYTYYGYVLWKTGEKEKAYNILEPYLVTWRRWDPWKAALTYSIMEEYDSAIFYLNKLEEISPYNVDFELTKHHSAFIPLQKNHEYNELIDRVDARKADALRSLGFTE